MSKSVSQEEVSKHNSEKNGVWIVIDNNVYDMSSLYFSSKKIYDSKNITVSMNIREERKFLLESLERMQANRYLNSPTFLYPGLGNFVNMTSFGNTITKES
jgi:predicted heme/steroid binding protein